MQPFPPDLRYLKLDVRPVINCNLRLSRLRSHAQPPSTGRDPRARQRRWRRDSDPEEPPRPRPTRRTRPGGLSGARGRARPRRPPPLPRATMRPPRHRARVGGTTRARSPFPQSPPVPRSLRPSPPRPPSPGLTQAGDLALGLLGVTRVHLGRAFPAGAARRTKLGGGAQALREQKQKLSGGRRGARKWWIGALRGISQQSRGDGSRYSRRYSRYRPLTPSAQRPFRAYKWPPAAQRRALTSRAARPRQPMAA